MGGVLVVREDPKFAKLNFEFVGDDFLTISRRISEFRRQIETQTWYEHRNGLRETGEQDDPNKQDFTGGLRARLDPELLPKQVRLVEGHSIPDFFATCGQYLVSPAFKATVEAIDPTGVQFIPVEVTDLPDVPDNGMRYFLFANTILNSLIEERGNFIVTNGADALPGLKPELFPLVLPMNSSQDDVSFLVRAAEVGRAGLWREQRSTSYLFASERLLNSLTEKALTGWDVSHRFDEV